MLVLVDGATGYLGTHLVHRLIQQDYKVRCLVRPQAAREDVDFLTGMGAQVVTGDLSPRDDCFKAFERVDCVAHLIGTIAPKKGEDLETLHAAKTKRLVDYCKEYRVPRIVHVTALGTADGAPSKYHATKWLAEEETRKSGLEYVILRPSLMVGRLIGRRDSKLVARYRDLIQHRDAVPLIGGGANRIQPIFIRDMVAALIMCLDKNILSEDLSGRTLELGGPDVVTMRQFVEALMDAVGRRRDIRPLPAQLASFVAWACELTQDVPLVSKDQVKLSLTDNICTDNALQSVLNIKPTELKKALETYKAEVKAN